MPWTKTTILLSSALLASGWGSAQKTTSSVTKSAMTQKINYADGNYKATGWYGGLPSSITVTLTLKDNLITKVSVQTHATDPTSLDYQRRFAAAVPKVVIGEAGRRGEGQQTRRGQWHPRRLQRCPRQDQGRG